LFAGLARINEADHHLTESRQLGRSGRAARPVRVLAHFFERFAEEDQPWLRHHAEVIVGMVAADSADGTPTRQPRMTSSSTAWRSR
jgi:hypothetical protein